MYYGNAHYEAAELETLLGKTLVKIVRADNEDGEELILYTSDNEQYKMYHEQDCCEHVSIEDIAGDLDDLIGEPLTMAEVTTNDKEDDEGSETWTYYKLATIKGYVTIRWYGSSNGYYSEGVDFVKVNDKEV